MGKYADALKKILENPEDMSTLPDLIGQIAQHEAEAEKTLADLGQSKELAHKYLKMIPIKDMTEPEPKKPEEPVIPTFKEIAEAIIKERA